LTQLKLLELTGTTVTDAGLEHIRPLSGLQNLTLYRTRVTATGVAELQKALPNLTVYR
jgi:hypothetical protein